MCFLVAVVIVIVIIVVIVVAKVRVVLDVVINETFMVVVAIVVRSCS